LPIDLPALLDRVHYRYPSFLIDAVGEHEPGRRLTAFKNLTINEDFFAGHFPGAPVMPAVLTIEALTQLAALLILEQKDVAPTTRVSLRGVNDAKFRRQVLPGDRLRLEVSMIRRRSRLAKIEAFRVCRRPARCGGGTAPRHRGGSGVHRSTADVHPSARLGAGTIIGAHCTIGPEVTIGCRCRIDASVVVDGWTEIGDETHIFPMASIGLAPQDLKYRGERTRLTIGKRNASASSPPSTAERPAAAATPPSATTTC
jgi:3-hydroxyacyl-[acyl-carrier-protein] dehydratase